MKQGFPFSALQFRQHASEPVVAVDLGYSASKPTCGIAVSWEGESKAARYQFGDAIRKVGDLCDVRPNAVLVIEAPLSGCHDGNTGNPKRRGEFETRRAWYCQPGATVALAAIRFLSDLAARRVGKPPITLSEAFLSNKTEKTTHEADAFRIARDFWDVQVIEAADDWGSLSPLVDGIPPVRCFAL